MIKRVLYLLLLLTQGMLVACSMEPEIVVVEITRLVPEIEEVEVTRLVEVEKEVTRLVEPPAATTPLPGGRANAATALDFLQIEFWPDYDRPSVLVLLTGAVPAGTALPVEISLPVPQDAAINAVAEIAEAGMTSIDYELEDETLRFQSDTPEFRVEYYAPYASSGSTRSYDFEWPTPYAINSLVAQIQRPLNASRLTSEPAQSRIISNPSDGLDYYLFDPRPLLQGTPYRLRFDYDMKSNVLTADELNSAAPGVPGSPLHNQEARYNPRTKS
jgi:hypothetical protein